MDTTVLQQKLSQQCHLLPSQQELLNRLLFQLAFNDFQNIGLVGAEGSGKSTLALALAELFSEQANVALLTAPLKEEELEAQLLQQWFGQRPAAPTLAELLAEPVADALPLLLIVDNFSLLSSSSQQKLLQLDCLSFVTLDQPTADVALNLSINVPTLQDAGQILRDKPLDPLAVAERFAASAGNMHLLHSAVVKPEERKTHSAAFWLLPTALVLLMFAALISWYFPTTSNAPQLSDIVTDNSPEPDNSPESINNPELVDSFEFILIPERSDLAGPLDTPELTDTSGLIDASTPAAMPEPVVPAELADIPPVTSVTAAVSAVAEMQYQEQQLLALPTQSRVLQLAVLSTERALQRFIQSYPDTEVVIYQRSWQGQLQWVILANGDFPDVSSARQARLALAEPLRAAGPFIKPVAQVQQEIKALVRLRAEPVLQE